MDGRVIAAHGRQYIVELPDRSRLSCFPRGKKSDVACGDRVIIEQTSDNQGVINTIQPRTSLLYRSNEVKQKLIAANVDQVVIVIATEPSFSDDLVTRALLAVESEEIEPLIVLNKCDLADKLPQARERVAIFAQLGYRILELSALEHAEDLRPALQGFTSVLVGQSGMGKSTLVNTLVPEAHAATREISSALDSGKHTTTHATLYHLDDESELIDSPGSRNSALAILIARKSNTPSANSALSLASAASATAATTVSQTVRYLLRSTLESSIKDVSQPIIASSPASAKTV